VLRKNLLARRTLSKAKILLLAGAVASFIVAFALTNSSRAAFAPLKEAAEEWSQFRGPNGTGVSAATGLPVEFGPTKNVVWKTALPPGHSSPVLTRNRIFITAHSQEKSAAPGKEKENYKLLVICLDRQTGKLLWQREVPRSRVGPLATRQWARLP